MYRHHHQDQATHQKHQLTESNPKLALYKVLAITTYTDIYLWIVLRSTDVRQRFRHDGALVCRVVTHICCYLS